MVGCIAILIWSSLALLTDLAGTIPPFQLVAMAFALGTIPGLVNMAISGARPGSLRSVPRSAWIVGVGGLFGYHFFYFIALQNAPAVEASLINYLWPLLIVLFSAALPGEHLRWWHIAGALLGMTGTLVLVTGGDGFSFQQEFLGGYAAAITCAVIWASYSVANRSFAHVPTDAVAGFCAATAILATICHLLMETTTWPEGWQWLAVIGLGLGPIGAAFYVWDFGTKHGDIRVLGALSYCGPLLSTIVLIVFDRADATRAVILACALIVAGAVIASGRFRRRR
jgi:drug/metabolite transporter (DMT)-like permease